MSSPTQLLFGVSDIQRLLSYMKQHPDGDQFFMSVNDISAFLSHSIGEGQTSTATSSGYNSPQNAASNNSSVSSGSSFIHTAFPDGPLRGDLPFQSNFSSTKGNNSNFHRQHSENKFFFDENEENYFSEDLHNMSMNESIDIDEAQNLFEKANLESDFTQQSTFASRQNVRPNVDFLSENFDSINFNIGLGDNKKDPKPKYGVKPRFGRTPSKKAFGTSSSSASEGTVPIEEEIFVNKDDEDRENRMSTGCNLDTGYTSDEHQNEFVLPSDIKFGVDFNKKVGSPPRRKVNKKKPRAAGQMFADSASSSAVNVDFEADHPVSKNSSSIEEIELEASVSSLRKLAKEYYSNEEYGKALDCFTEVLEMCPPSWPAFVTVLANRSATFMMLDRFEEVITDSDHIIALDPKHIKINCRKGRALLKLGRLLDAECALTRVLEASPSDFGGNADPDAIKAEARSVLKMVISADALMDKLTSLCGRAAYDSILPLVEEVLSLCPFAYGCIVTKATALTAKRLYKECREFINETISVMHHSLLSLYSHPKASRNYPDKLSLAWREDENGKLCANDVIIVNFLLYMGPSLASLYLTGLKNIDFCKTHPTAVINIVDVILSKLVSITSSDPTWVWAHEMLAKVKTLFSKKTEADSLFNMESYSESIRCYTEALKADPDATFWNAVLFSNRAAAYMSLFMHREALADCNSCINRQPEYWKAYLRRARVHKALDDYPASVRDYRMFIYGSSPLHPDYVDAQKEIDEISTLLAAAETSRAKQRATWSDTKSKNESSSGNPSKPSSTQGSRPTHPNMKPNEGGFFRQRESGFRSFHSKSKPEATSSSSYAASEKRVREKTHYEILGVSSNADDKVLKAAYRTLALKYHPDKCKEPNAEEVFKSINGAYAVLNDKALRREYDLTLPH